MFKEGVSSVRIGKTVFSVLVNLFNNTNEPDGGPFDRYLYIYLYFSSVLLLFGLLCVIEAFRLPWRYRTYERRCSEKALFSEQI